MNRTETIGTRRVERWATTTIVWYQRAREGQPSPCRFTPSCSAYALEALEGHGMPRGLLLTLRRLVRCRPFGPSGYDPVPTPPPLTPTPAPPQPFFETDD